MTRDDVNGSIENVHGIVPHDRLVACVGTTSIESGFYTQSQWVA
jgi:hypothetical protein